MKIAFITDGGNDMGMGHIMRTLTLAKEVGSENEIVFLTLSDETVTTEISSRGFEFVRFSTDNEIFNSLATMNFDTIVIDKPPVSPDFMKKVRESFASRIVLMDSGLEASRFATIAVNGLKTADFENRRYTDEKNGTLHFSGPKYLILKPEFETYHRESVAAQEEATRILLIYGGSDPLNLTSKTLRELLKMEEENFKIDIIMGPKFAFSKEVNEIIQEFEGMDKVKLHRNVENVAEIMVGSELVFTSAGLSMFEALVVGCNVIVASQNKLQRNNYDYFFKRFNNAPKKFTFVEETFMLTQSDEKVREMEIGMGHAEVIESILDM